MSTVQEIIDFLSEYPPETRVVVYDQSDRRPGHLYAYQDLDLSGCVGGRWDSQSGEHLAMMDTTKTVGDYVKEPPVAKFKVGDVVRTTEQTFGEAAYDLGVGALGVVTGIIDDEDEIEPIEALFGYTYYIFAPEELEVLDDDELTAGVIGPLMRSLVGETR